MIELIIHIYETDKRYRNHYLNSKAGRLAYAGQE